MADKEKSVDPGFGVKVPVDPGYGKPDFGARLEEIIAAIRDEISQIPHPDHTLPGEDGDSFLERVVKALAKLLVEFKERLEARPRPDNTLPEKPKAEPK